MSASADIKAELLARIDSLVRDLAPNGYRAGAYWMACNPARDDRRPGSFWVALTGTPGAWRDEATGEKGDVFGLIQLAVGCDFRGAMDWAREWLGGAGADVPCRPVAEASRHAEAEAEEIEKKRRQAKAVYLKSRKLPFRGSVADTYLKSRGIELARFGRVPGALGVLAEERHLESGRMLPCMVAAMTGADGRLAAIHRTFLAPDGSGKADVTPARKIWPSFRGAAIRLWRGESGMSVAEAGRHGLIDTLILTEGVEDGLSVALAAPTARVWAVGSLGNLGCQVLPETALTVIVCADNDWGKPQAAAQLDRAVEALARQDRRRDLRVARSPIGKDANDALRGSW